MFQVWCRWERNHRYPWDEKVKDLFSKNIWLYVFRTISAVYEMVGEPTDRYKAEELFRKLDENSDGEISQEEFINIIKQDHKLLNVLKTS